MGNIPKIGIIADNELNDDPRINRQIIIFKELGYEVFCLCYGYYGVKYKAIEGIYVERIWVPRVIKNLLFFVINTLPLFDLLWNYRIMRFIRRYKINVLHANDLYMSKPSYKAIRRSKSETRLVLDLHENFPAAVETYNWTRGFIRGLVTQPSKWQKKEKRYLSYADYIIVLSEWYKSLLLSKYLFLSAENIYVFPNCLDLGQIEEFDRKQLAIDFDKLGPVFLYFGVIAERRGIFLAIEAFKELVLQGFESQFLIIGPVDKADRLRFLSIIHEESLSKYITYIPWIDVSYLPSYLKVSDAGIAPFLKNPQHDSGVSNKIYQYMYGGLPVIVSDCESQKRLVEKYNCGLTFSSYSELIAAMRRIFTDYDDLKLKGMNGKRAILSELNLDNSKSEVISLYSKIESEY